MGSLEAAGFGKHQVSAQSFRDGTQHTENEGLHWAGTIEHRQEVRWRMLTTYGSQIKANDTLENSG